MMTTQNADFVPPVTLADRVNIHAVEIAILAKRVQQLQQDQADIVLAFEADRLPVRDAGRTPPRNAKGWDVQP